MRQLLVDMGFTLESIPLNINIICCRRGMTIYTNSSCTEAEIDAALKKALEHLLSSAPASAQRM